MYRLLIKYIYLNDNNNALRYNYKSFINDKRYYM